MPERKRLGGHSPDFQLMFLGDVDSTPGGATLQDGEGLIWDEAQEKFVHALLGPATQLTADVVAGLNGSDDPGAVNPFVTRARLPLNVKDFGAVGDNVTNDTVAIQAAIDESIDSGRSIYFPPGRYRVAPTASRVLNIGTASLVGAGKGQTIIKLIDSAGPWDYFFYETANGVSGMTLRDLTIDLNTTNNPIVNLAEIQAHPRVAVYLNPLDVSSRVVIENVEFADNNSINTIITNENVSDVIVHGCSFINALDANEIAHDHSTLYLISTYNHVEGNYFEGDGLPNIASATAVETHGSHTTIANNRITKFGTGFNITGVSSVEDTTEMSVVGNVMDQMSTAAVIMWSQQYLTHTTGYGLDGVTIVGNVAHIKQTSTPAGTSAFGIAVEANSNLPLHNINISNNVLVFELEGADRNANDTSFGIGFVSVSGETLEECIIANNIIENMPMAGIRLSCAILNVNIHGNILNNCGSTLHAEVPAYRTPFFFAPTSVHNLSVKNNVITDGNDTTRIPYAMYFATPSSGTPSGISIIDNEVNIDGATKTAFQYPYLFEISCNIYGRGRILDGYAAPQYGQVAGSEWWDVSLLKKNVILNTGGAWRQEAYGTAAPVAGTWAIGSVVWNYVPSAGGPPGWVCTAAGTPGTWKAMANLAA